MIKRIFPNFLILVFFLFSNAVNAQYQLKIRVVNDEKKILTGVTALIEKINKTVIADKNGEVIFEDLAAGNCSILFTHVGYKEKRIDVQIPAESSIEVLLEEAHEHEEEVIIMATRTSRTIYDLPTRVEVISGEELEEKSNMKPGEIRMLLNESTGIQIQQTSATSYNSSIRIQGLDGRYTQLLRDGYPVYGGFSGGLSLLQVSPLDLKQVEVIKGSVSTLYGGGAIAGLVNLVSKTPGEKQELNFLTNFTSAGGSDLSGFYSQRFTKTGVTVFASRNTGKEFDPAGIGFSAIPKFTRYSIHPRVFFYGERLNVDVGVNFITEDRLGGSIDFIRKRETGYFENNQTKRFTTQLGIQYVLNKENRLGFKSSFSYLERLLEAQAYVFGGEQKTLFSELTLTTEKENSILITGLNFINERFDEIYSGASVRDYAFAVPGAFMQHSWKTSDAVSIESGLRLDHAADFGWELLPRISFLYKPGAKTTLRIGGGKGYKMPGLFSEESERILFKNLLPLDINNLQSERSTGANVDVNYRTGLGALGISFNHLFFYTRLNRPLMLTQVTGGYRFENSDGFIDTKGMETNIKLTYEALKLFIGYSFTDAQRKLNGTETRLAMTSKHRLNNVLMFEKEGKFRSGFEAYYFSPQFLNDGTTGKSYWIFGLMGEVIFGKIAVFVNFENFTDTRQTRMGSIYSGSVLDPQFKDIYAPLDGFVMNGGLRIKL
ncbi:MAG: TonB-dependent receptor [Flavisolibacter sp.]|jgi:iron complex outermembrane receptor protein|nr:TonB-dependent receptor [Flavisolibacter sp.]